MLPIVLVFDYKLRFCNNTMKEYKTYSIKLNIEAIKYAYKIEVEYYKYMSLKRELIKLQH
jgi:hypothetical protein